uniref:Uncharacterized protein n=1 Tax=Anguilla anguilla TaxID=7936 RepID=A0A0E9P606_ANGAN
MALCNFQKARASLSKSVMISCYSITVCFQLKCCSCNVENNYDLS